MLSTLALSMYKGTNALAWMNKKNTLNSAFYGMNLVKMWEGSDVSGNDITNV